jgi:hypothetical protein
MEVKKKSPKYSNTRRPKKKNNPRGREKLPLSESSVFDHLTTEA